MATVLYKEMGGLGRREVGGNTFPYLLEQYSRITSAITLVINDLFRGVRLGFSTKLLQENMIASVAWQGCSFSHGV